MNEVKNVLGKYKVSEGNFSEGLKEYYEGYNEFNFEEIKIKEKLIFKGILIDVEDLTNEPMEEIWENETNVYSLWYDTGYGREGLTIYDKSVWNEINRRLIN